MSELIPIFINNIVPILLIAAIGFWAAYRLNLPPKPISTLLYYILSPALVFYAMYVSEISGGEIVVLALVTTLFQLIMAGLTLFVLRFQQVSQVERANLMIGTFCLNAGNYGLPLVSFAFGPEVFNRAVIIFIVNTALNYSYGVYVASNGRSTPRQALGNVLRTPAVYAIIAAFGLRILSIELPLALERSSQTLSEATIPMMLILLGVQMAQFKSFGRLRLVAVGVVLKMLIAPLLAVGLVLIFSLGREAATAVIMQLSMPTAVVTIVLTTEFDLDEELALNLIMMTTLLSPITLSILIALLI